MKGLENYSKKALIGSALVIAYLFIFLITITLATLIHNDINIFLGGVLITVVLILISIIFGILGLLEIKKDPKLNGKILSIVTICTSVFMTLIIWGIIIINSTAK